MNPKLTLPSQSLILGFVVLLAQLVGYGQETSDSLQTRQKTQRQLELRHDNDVFGGSDRYYTTGNFITYRYGLTGARYAENPEQISFTLQQEIYTPTNKLARNTDNLDRPYAGFLGISVGWSKANPSTLVNGSVLLGVAGPASGAEAFQSFFHSLGIGAEFEWFQQIENSVHINTYLDYIKEWQLVQGSWGLIAAIKPGFAVGTKDVFAQQEVAFFFGKRNELRQSLAYNQLGVLQDELFVKLRANYRYVKHDGMLEGNLVSDQSPFLVGARPNVLMLGFDVFWRWGRNDFKAGYNYNTAKFSRGESHMFATLSVARRL